MATAGAQDSALRLSQLLELMWCIHGTYEGLSEHDINLYRVGIQTFLLEEMKEVETLRETLEVNKEYLDRNED